MTKRLFVKVICQRSECNEQLWVYPQSSKETVQFLLVWLDLNTEVQFIYLFIKHLIIHFLMTWKVKHEIKRTKKSGMFVYSLRKNGNVSNCDRRVFLKVKLVIGFFVGLDTTGRQWFLWPFCDMSLVSKLEIAAVKIHV